MKSYVMIVIFEDGTVELCKVTRRTLDWVEIFPLEGNIIITTDFKTVCSSNDELIEELRINYPHIASVTIKRWEDEKESVH